MEYKDGLWNAIYQEAVEKVEREKREAAAQAPPVAIQPFTEQIAMLPLDVLEDYPAELHPFHPASAARLESLRESIVQNGILAPLLVRDLGDGRYQILAGHNRKRAAKLAGYSEVPCIIKDVDDIDANNIMLADNLNHRPELLPSEKAMAYKMMLDNMRKRQGERTDLTSCQNGTKLAETRADQKLSKNSTDSARQIQRYIRLTYLIPQLLELVDAGKLKLVAGSDISFLPQNIQEILADLMINEGVTVSTAKAAELKRVQPKSELELRAILVGTPKPPTVKVTLELPEIDAPTVEALNHNTEFQTEARRVLAELAKQYTIHNVAENSK